MRPPVLVVPLLAAMASVVLGAPGPTQSQSVTALGSAALDGQAAAQQAGRAVAGLGDVNRDGLADVAVSDATGAVTVVLGSRTPAGGGLGSFAATSGRGFRIVGPPGFGDAITGVGDMNGDGRRDIAIAQPGATVGGRAVAGAVYVVFSPATPRDIAIASLGADGFLFAGAAAGDRAGASLADAGDLNGDGAGDLLIGAPGVSTGGLTSRGAAFVVQGLAGSGAFDLIPAPGGVGRFLGERAGDRVGHSVAAADFTGDGTTDLAMGDARFGGAAAHVVSGANRSSFDLGQLQTLQRGFSVSSFAGSAEVAALPDQNGDGRADLLLGFSDAATNAGGAVVFFGTSALGRLTIGDLDGLGYRIDPPGGNTQFGGAVASVGDQNGDGLGDMLIGGRGTEATLVFGGARTEPVAASALGSDGARLTTPDLDAAFGDLALSGAGDVTGDGRPDMLVGIAAATVAGVPNSGRAWLVPRALAASTVPPAATPSASATSFAVRRLRVSCPFTGTARFCRGRILLTATTVGRVRITLTRGVRVVRLTIRLRAGANVIRVPRAIRGTALGVGRYRVKVVTLTTITPPLTAPLRVRRR